MDSANRGFTLIELLIVIAISAIFSTLAIVYSSVGKNGVALTVEESEIAQAILQAKQLSITTYTDTTSGVTLSCGYGVVINSAARTYSIFAYDPQGLDANGDPIKKCQQVAPGDIYTRGIANDEEKPYTQGTWNVPIPLGVNVLSKSDSLVTVLFYPPDPTVFSSTQNDPTSFSNPATTLFVHLQTADQQNSADISISPLGQVSF